MIRPFINPCRSALVDGAARAHTHIGPFHVEATSSPVTGERSLPRVRTLAFRASPTHTGPASAVRHQLRGSRRRDGRRGRSVGCGQVDAGSDPAAVEDAGSRSLSCERYASGAARKRRQAHRALVVSTAIDVPTQAPMLRRISIGIDGLSCEPTRWTPCAYRTVAKVSSRSLNSITSDPTVPSVFPSNRRKHVHSIRW
jgi:hypothetical protein